MFRWYFLFGISDKDLCKDILAMTESLKVISQTVTEDMEYAFHQDMYHTQSPEIAAEQIVKALFEEFGSVSNRDAQIFDSVSIIRQFFFYSTLFSVRQ